MNKDNIGDCVENPIDSVNGCSLHNCPKHQHNSTVRFEACLAKCGGSNLYAGILLQEVSATVRNFEILQFN